MAQILTIAFLGLSERKRTTKFIVGPTSHRSTRMTSNGPWALLATNHQTVLRSADDAGISRLDGIFGLGVRLLFHSFFSTFNVLRETA